MSKPVLVIDDDADVLDAMRLVLGSEGYDVRCANGGREALALLDSGMIPALVVTDVMMPDMTGWDILATMQRHPVLCRVPVVLATASFVMSCPEGIEILEKPFDLDKLLATVDKHCSHPPDGYVPEGSRPAPSSRRRIHAA